MRTLTRYFLARYLKLFALILAASIFAVAMFESMIGPRALSDGRSATAGLLSHLLHRVPSYYFRDLIPVAGFAAAFFAFALPARHREITAIKSAGLSPRRAAIPVLAAAAALSAVALAFGQTFALAAHPQAGFAALRGSLWYARGDSIYNAGAVDAGRGLLEDARAYDLDPEGRLLAVTSAARVEIDADGGWNFVDATTQRFAPALATAPRVVHAARWRREVAPIELLIPSDARTHLLARLAEPWTILLFAMLAIPAGLAVDSSRSLAASALAGVAILGAYYTARTTGELLFERGFALATLHPGLILLGFGALAALGWARVRC